MLNLIWCAFFLISVLYALIHFAISGEITFLEKMVNSTFAMSKTAFEISIGLTGIMAFWLGMMNIAEKAGLVQKLALLVSPIMTRIFPEVPKDHPAMGSMMMNLAANMLGLDNSATPLGLKAMKELHELNPKKDTASNAQIMFLVVNTSAVTLIPVSIFSYLYELGHKNPAELFVPILLATFCSTFFGVLITSLIQKQNIFKSGLFPIFLIFGLLLGLFAWFLVSLKTSQVQFVSQSLSYVVILLIVSSFVFSGLIKRRNVYEDFVEGAKEGFKVAIMVIPYLVAMLVAIGIFRASGCMEFVIETLRSFFALFLSGRALEFVDALPTAFMKPLSGSGARGLMIDTIKTHGVDSLVASMVATIQGSTETTFYVLAVYFGSVQIRKTRHAIIGGLSADFFGILSAIIISYLFFA